MESQTLQDKITFYKEKISICEAVKSKIPIDDDYKDIKIESMNNRIRIYEEELSKLKADNLRNWI